MNIYNIIIYSLLKNYVFFALHLQVKRQKSFSISLPSLKLSDPSEQYLDKLAIFIRFFA